MTYQIFLTAWLVLQMVLSTSSQPKISKLKGHSDSQLRGAIIGTILRHIGMFFCLYMGGFYN